MKQLLEQVQQSEFLDSPKLWQIFEYAEKNLTQIKYSVGDDHTKQACALGAINFYMTGGTSHHGYGCGHPNYDKLTDSLVQSFGAGIVILNNYRDWTFTDFKNFCKEKDI